MSGFQSNPPLFVVAKKGAGVFNGDSLHIRFFSCTGFEQLIHCPPQRVTIVPGSMEHSSAVRDVLMECKDSQNIKVRFGSGKLQPSEVYVVGRRREFLRHKSLEKLLDAAGAPSAERDQLLEAFAIDRDLNESPENLSSCEQRRLLLACAFYTRARVILFNNPFQNIERAFQDKTADAIQQLAEQRDQIFIITGIANIPVVWRNSQSVRIEEVYSPDDGVARARPLDETVILTLRDFTKQEYTPERTRTRPQVSARNSVRAAVPAALQSEAIENPHLRRLLISDILGPDFSADPFNVSDLAIETIVEERRPRKRTLTRISRIERLMYGWPKALIRRVQARIFG